jgi:hypothetical protein
MPKKDKKVNCEICDRPYVVNSKCVKLPNHLIVCEGCQAQHPLKMYKVACVWTVTGHYEIPARNLKEAIAIANDPACSMPPDPDYVPDSFEIDEDMCEELEGEEV